MDAVALFTTFAAATIALGSTAGADDRLGWAAAVALGAPSWELLAGDATVLALVVEGAGAVGCDGLFCSYAAGAAAAAAAEASCVGGRWGATEGAAGLPITGTPCGVFA